MWSVVKGSLGFVVLDAKDLPLAAANVDYKAIASVWSNRADAHMIAAAPTMLEALKVARDVMWDHDLQSPESIAWHFICDAIAKAEG